tara:strand:- start:411 stop:551 length:141 start_codon:yes stop_codon:yes gene_type:complete
MSEVTAREVRITFGAQPPGLNEVSHDSIGFVDAEPALSKSHRSGQV